MKTEIKEIESLFFRNQTNTLKQILSFVTGTDVKSIIFIIGIINIGKVDIYTVCIPVLSQL